MRITFTTNTNTRRTFTDVEMIIIDETEMCIWQPQIGNKRGSRRTRLPRNEIVGIVYVQTKESNNEPMEDTKTSR